MDVSKDNITGLILAGGKATRMGGDDKGLMQLANKPMIAYIIARLAPQTSQLIINANRNHATYASYGLPVVKDKLSGFYGPLAGIASVLETITTDYLITSPCDSPFISKDLVSRLAQTLVEKKTVISVAHDGERLQPVFCMLHKSLAASLNDYLAKGQRKIDRWFANHDYALTDFSNAKAMFDNINTREDIAHAETRLQHQS